MLNWIENSNWTKVAVTLPVPMFAFTPTICDDFLLIVGYTGANLKRCKNCFKIKVNDVLKLDRSHQQEAKDLRINWIQMADTTYLHAALVRSSPVPMVVGGENHHGKTTGKIDYYDNCTNSWISLASLSSARSSAAAVAVNNNAIIVIGGYAEGDSIDNALDSSLYTVELGQAEIITR